MGATIECNKYQRKEGLLKKSYTHYYKDLELFK